jgi:hypothetical protein
MEMTCFEVEPGRVEPRPASHRREWMDATPHSFAYQCTPLVMANGHGWEMICPITFEAVWDGGQGQDAVRITFVDGEPPAKLVHSHFGSGILTFNPAVIIRTPPGYNLWISGTPNWFKDGIAPLSALIESDWLPFTFSMNWKLTRPGLTVRFDRGDPFCFFYPMPRGLVDETEPRIASLMRDPELASTYLSTLTHRNVAVMFNVKEQIRGWYTRGEMPEGAPAPEGHQTRVAAKPFLRI